MKKKKEEMMKKGKENIDLTVYPCIKRSSLYPLHHGGHCRDYSYLSEIISCSVLTDNDECIRVYYGKGRMFVLLNCYPFSRM